MCSRVLLFIIGVVLILMGIAGLIPGIYWAYEPMWHAIGKIIVGVIAVIVPVIEAPRRRKAKRRK